jgi:hypothetical protein
MKSRDYNIKIHSVSRFFIAWIIILISSMLLLDEYTPRIENEIISVIQFLAVFVTSVYLAHLIGMAQAKVTFTEQGFIHTWKRRFLFSREKDIRIPWELVDNYLFHEDRTLDSFYINLTTKKRYKINQLNVLPINDDFKKLIKDFPRLSNKYKIGTSSNIETKTINEGKSIYANKEFKWIFYIFTLGFIILLLTKILNPESETTWSSLGVIGTGLLFYGAMIKEKKRNN